MALQHISAQLKSNPPRHFSQVSPSRCWDDRSCAPVQARQGVVAVLTACAASQGSCSTTSSSLCLFRVCTGEAEAPQNPFLVSVSPSGIDNLMCMPVY